MSRATMTNSNMFNEAVDAIYQGDTDRALDLLMRLLRIDKDNPDYWLWMSSVVSSSREQVYCLQNVLRLDPENIPAKQGLILMGILAGNEVMPVPPVKRTWKTVLVEDGQELKGFRRFIATPLFKILVFSGTALVFLGLVLGGILGTRGAFKPKLTITPIAWTSTPTRTSSQTPKVRAATVTSIVTSTPEPLWMMLDATYTPVPLYVNTPHPRLEAYRLAMRAYERGDYKVMINFLEQTLQSEEATADLEFYLGEGYRFLGNYENALQKYQTALEIDHHFAPAYLSRALVMRQINPRYDVLSDFNDAIEIDPYFADAYKERAVYYSEYKDYQLALEDLEMAIQIMPTNPELYLESAKVYLASGEYSLALKQAEIAHQIDRTLLQGYLVLANALLLNHQPEDALDKLEIYGLYYPDDPLYLALYGGALYEIGINYNDAYKALDRSISLDDSIAMAYYYHGLTAMEVGKSNRAVNDFYLARSLAPDNFDINIWFAVALYAEGRYEDAFRQLDASEALIKSDENQAIYYYYRGVVGLELSHYREVEKAWRALLNLPEGVVDDAWLEEANNYFIPPTDTPTP